MARMTEFQRRINRATGVSRMNTRSIRTNQHRNAYRRKSNGGNGG